MLDQRLKIAATVMAALVGLAIIVALVLPKGAAPGSRVVTERGSRSRANTESLEGPSNPGTRSGSRGRSAAAQAGKIDPKTGKPIGGPDSKGKGAPGGKSGSGRTPGTVGDSRTSGTLMAGVIGPDGKPLSPGGKMGVPGGGYPGGKTPAGAAGGTGSSGSSSSLAGNASGSGTTPEGEVTPTATPADPNGSATVAGGVTRGSAPVPGAVLRLQAEAAAQQYDATTGSDGKYQFASIPPGSYLLILLSPASQTPQRRLALEANDQRTSEDFVIPDYPRAHGTVVSDATGAGVPNPILSVFSGDRGFGDTQGGTDGSFTLPPLEPGSYTLKVTAADFQNGEKSVVLTDQPGDAIEIRLKPSGVELTGRVMSDTGPVSGAYVALMREGAAYGDPYASVPTVVSDGSGNFRISSIPEGAGPFRAVALRAGLVPGSSNPVDPSAAGAHIANIQLATGAALKGRVVDSSSKAIEDASVRITDGFSGSRTIYERFHVPFPSVTTGRDGAFTLSGIEPGAAKVEAGALNYVTKSVDVTAAGATTQVPDIVLDSSDVAAEGRIFGSVIDDLGHGITTDVFVSCTSCQEVSEARQNADPAGNFTFEHLKEGTYTADTNGSLIRGNVWTVLRQRVGGLQTGGPATTILFDLSHKATVEVVDGGGSPISRFEVSVSIDDNPGNGDFAHQQYDRAVIETTSGSGTIEALMSGVASFVITVPDYGTAHIDQVTIPVHGDVSLGRVVIGQGATVTGVAVASESHTPLSGLSVRAMAPPGAPADHPLNTTNLTRTTDQTGRFTIAGLPEGGFDLKFEGPGRAVTRYSGFTATAGQPLNVGDQIVPAGATIRGRVTDAGTGNGIADAIIQVAGVMAFSDGAGNYEATTLPGGDYTYLVSDRNGLYRQYTQPITTVSGQAQTINAALTRK